MQYLKKKKKRRYILKLGGGNEMISSLCKWNTITKSKKKTPAMYNHKQVMPDCSGNPLNSVTLDKRDIF